MFFQCSLVSYLGKYFVGGGGLGKVAEADVGLENEYRGVGGPWPWRGAVQEAFLLTSNLDSVPHLLLIYNMWPVGLGNRMAPSSSTRYG